MDLDFLKNLNIDFQKDALLSDHTTFRIGGHCPGVITCRNYTELSQTIGLLNENNVKFIILGQGSNVLVSDQGLSDVVVRFISDEPLIEINDNLLTVSGSTLLDDLCDFAADKGLDGLNFASGIPGTVAGAIVGNAGAFGQQIGDSIESVKCITTDGNEKIFSKGDLVFSYRNSMFKNSSNIIVSATFFLYPKDEEILCQKRREILDLREEKHPDYREVPCAGSFFRNIEPTSDAGRRESAGWYLEQVGAKQLNFNGAKVFDKHANIIINTEKCQAKDIYDLASEMKNLVKNKFNIDLIQEVCLIGEF